MIRCKFVVAKIEDNAGPDSKKVTFETRYCPEVEEDRRFTKWTPSGSMTTVIDNPAAVAQLKEGGQCYIDITPIPAG